ncbi:suppressor of fused domain protein [Flammeovirga sp. SJP92]|uniref:suppressor of fused domain protein n=1 Tax=Flammeovirga sp. SJP92 TaxID=1775430 RepID=UPI0007887E9E|nr:suppressor of fused domain protein [Flammeovirga sp. SJP92]KXX69784.1 hypothetical protein AVL50_12910 [Flammeovirga sp. SJP92]
MENSLGWKAIDNALDNLYQRKENKHFAPEIVPSLGGDDYLEGVSVYFNESNYHYHYISYGLSELHEKVSEDSKYSGWGYELTFRLKKVEGEEEIPTWPVNLLEQVAKATYENEIIFDAYHTIFSGPVDPESNTKIEAILFVKDPELGTIQTEFGEVTFLQLFGLTESEYEGITEKSIDRRAFIKKEQLTNPQLITDITRG